MGNLSLDYATLPWHPNVRIIHTQGPLLAIYKPCGVLSHPNTAGVCQNSILRMPYHFPTETYLDSTHKLYLLNRLDSPTSGLMLLCTDLTLAREIQTLFKLHRVKKVYHAIVKGFIPKERWVWRDYLSSAKENGCLRTHCVHASGVFAQTEVRLINPFSINGERFSWIELHPRTGRTHQLRVQCAQHHFPILGDQTYGHFKCNRKFHSKRLYLHAQSIALDTTSGHFEAHCDSEFDTLMP